jgi:ribonuclease HI
MKVKLYPDGAAFKNPGPGGYAAILICGGQRKEFSAGYRRTTNNRMEIMSAIVGLRALEERCHVDIVSDSQYVVNGINSWLKLWKKKNWMAKSKKPVLNQDLWMELDMLLAKHDAKAHWIKGHTDSQGQDAIENRRADILAESAAANSATGIDFPYETLNPPQAFAIARSRQVISTLQPLENELSRHDRLIQSELIWSDAELEID